MVTLLTLISALITSSLLRLVMMLFSDSMEAHILRLDIIKKRPKPPPYSPAPTIPPSPPESLLRYPTVQNPPTPPWNKSSSSFKGSEPVIAHEDSNAKALDEKETAEYQSNKNGDEDSEQERKEREPELGRRLYDQRLKQKQQQPKRRYTK